MVREFSLCHYGKSSLIFPLTSSSRRQPNPPKSLCFSEVTLACSETTEQNPCSLHFETFPSIQTRYHLLNLISISSLSCPSLVFVFKFLSLLRVGFLRTPGKRKAHGPHGVLSSQTKKIASFFIWNHQQHPPFGRGENGEETK